MQAPASAARAESKMASWGVLLVMIGLGLASRNEYQKCVCAWTAEDIDCASVNEAAGMLV
jgi:hypothetical protein